MCFILFSHVPYNYMKLTDFTNTEVYFMMSLKKTEICWYSMCRQLCI